MPEIEIPEGYHHHHRLPEQMRNRCWLSQTGSISKKFIKWKMAMTKHHHRHLWAGMCTWIRICVVLCLSLSRQVGKVCITVPWK
jgi:hypothetical protein